jgi:DNA-directed RNA polymerase II subunit RPB1
MCCWRTSAADGADGPVATSIAHIDRRKPSDLDPVYIIDAENGLQKKLIVVRSDDPISRECQTSATLNFCMHLRATFATRRVLEKYHLTREAFDWVLGPKLHYV